MQTIFREEGAKVFSIDYIPERTPYREDVIDDLYNYLLNAIETGEYRPVVIVGPSGTGKTMVISKVINRITEDDYLSQKATAAVINTTIANSIYAVIKKITGFLTPIPERGLSISDILRRLETSLTTRGLKYIIGLDDADEMMKKEKGKLVYLLTRLGEEMGEQILYPIFIIRDTKLLRALPDHIKSKIGGPIYRFSPYKRGQLIEIIQERIDKGLKPDTVSKHAVEVAAINTEVIYGGNAREMINLIYRSALYAERQGLRKIDAETIREVFFYTFYNNVVREIRHPIKKEIMKMICRAVPRDEYLINEKILGEIYGEAEKLGMKKKEVESVMRKLAVEDGYLLKEDRYLHTLIPRTLFNV